MTDAPDALRGRLQVALERLSIARSRRDDDTEAMLRKRSALLAQRKLQAETRALLDEVVVVRRGRTVFATPLLQTREVRRVEVVPVPGATQTIVGMFQVRGRTCALADLGPLFGEAALSSPGSAYLVLVVSGSRGDLGLHIDDVIGPRGIYSDELADGDGGSSLEFVAKVTTDLVHVIDVEAVLGLPAVRLRGVL